MKEYDIILTKLKNKEITQWEARKQIFCLSSVCTMFVCPNDSKFAGTIVATRAKRCLDVYWCLGKLISV
jgi:hypothetical protein